MVEKARSDAEAEIEISATHLAWIARMIDVISGDLAGFGPFVHQSISAQSGPGVAARLALILKDLEGLACDLRAQRQQHLERLMRKLDIKEGDTGLKLHIGCGRHILDSWINIDFHPAPLAMDVRWGLPFRDGCAAFVFLSHALEHFYYPQEALPLARDIRRVLQPGGVLRVIVPDIEKCLRAYVEDDGEFFASRRKTWTWWPPRSTKLADFLTYAGAGSCSGHASHKFGYDYETLRHLLITAGFQRVERSEYMSSSHGALLVDNSSLVAGATYGKRYYSLFVEGTA